MDRIATSQPHETIAELSNGAGPDRDGALAAASAGEIIESAAEAAREMLGMDMAYVADMRNGLQDYRVVAGDGESFGAAVNRPVPLEGTYCEMLLEGQLQNIVRDSAADPLVAQLEITERGRVGSYIGVPLVLSSGETYGTFCCLSHEPNAELRDRDISFMRVLARLIADQLQREEFEAEKRRAEINEAKVEALLVALAARDGYTGAHSEKVVDLAVAIAENLQLSDQDRLDIENAALLHDIGKIGVPDAILNKPGKLTDREWEIMHRHPIVAAEIVGAMGTLAHLAPIVRAEHERWDGKGYPDGLKGEEIPLVSRIVLVADAYHAMTSDRPYRKALSREGALAELEKNAGSQFCPTIATAALTAITHAAE